MEGKQCLLKLSFNSSKCFSNFWVLWTQLMLVPNLVQLRTLPCPRTSSLRCSNNSCSFNNHIRHSLLMVLNLSSRAPIMASSSSSLVQISTPRLQVANTKLSKLSHPMVVLAPSNNTNSMVLLQMTKIMVFQTLILILTNNIWTINSNRHTGPNNLRPIREVTNMATHLLICTIQTCNLVMLNWANLFRNQLNHKMRCLSLCFLLSF